MAEVNLQWVKITLVFAELQKSTEKHNCDSMLYFIELMRLSSISLFFLYRLFQLP